MTSCPDLNGAECLFFLDNLADAFEIFRPRQRRHCTVGGLQRGLRQLNRHGVPFDLERDPAALPEAQQAA